MGTHRREKTLEASLCSIVCFGKNTPTSARKALFTLHDLKAPLFDTDMTVNKFQHEFWEDKL